MNERGAVSAVGLCVLTAVLLLGLAAAQFMHSGARISAEYEREMQLRLAAESGVETAVARLERTPSAFDPLPERDADAYGAPPARNQRKEITEEGVPVGDGIKLHLFLEGSDDEEPQNALKVIAAAIDSDAAGLPHVSDGVPWMRAKIVRARMQKKGDRYVWRRWF